ncbi:ShlB/FhaC/HecB family hemolysin secretion/activation protein [Maritimibacter sp. 55A14]|uniref:ShlB/FhaC/HecB family hemolysin secretion/activation protein n=1 Tax=Maritimibacter sp. 55A14 TaxID=2174844 RepID=UPI0011B22831|nr:ShlB/FhaC/HecB family hemolysin secretion/activation protein [Maritimibacter sp. 55A14]
MRRLISAALLLLAVGSGLHAQEQDPGRRILEEQRRRERLEELERAQAGQEVVAPEAKGVVREEVCFPIDEIVLTGVTVLKPRVLEPIVAEFSGRCLGQASIGHLLQRISGAYADKGYITTRAYVPAQDISSRELRIDVLEGRIEAFVYTQLDKDGQPRKSPQRKILSAFPARAGDVFQLRDVEHGLEQINRLASSQANANLTAGTAPGTSRVVVTEQKVDTVRGTVGIDNQGADESGETQIRLGLEADDLLRLNDTYTLSYSGAENSNALALSMSVPFRKWLFSANASYSEALTNLSPTSDLFTQTANLGLRAERLIMRDARSKYYVYGALSSYWNERFVNIAALTPQHRSAWRIGFRHEHRLEKAVIAADTALSFGAGFLGADRDPAVPVPGAPQAEYTALEIRINYIRPLENGRQFSLAVIGQIADAPLFSNEQLAIGGWNSVRGYNGFDVSGDSGFFLRSEYRFKASPLDLRDWGKAFKTAGNWTPLRNAQGGVSPYLFADMGHVYSRATRTAAYMVSIGAGLTARLGKTTLSGSLAMPLRNENGQTAGEVQALLSLSAKLF